jgi:hypothetical protein
MMLTQAAAQVASQYAEPAIYSVLVIICSAVVAVTQWAGWWKITQLNGEIKSLSSVVNGMPNAVAVQVSKALEGVWRSHAGLEHRVTVVETKCTERHGYQAQGPSSPPHGTPVYRDTED